MECIWNGEHLVLQDSWVTDLPEDVKLVLEGASNARYLEALAELALQPVWTLRIFSHFQPLQVEICNRWLADHDVCARSEIQIFGALARLLSLHPNLVPYAIELACVQRRGFFRKIGAMDMVSDLAAMPVPQLGGLLLAFYRCLRFDQQAFISLFNGPQIQALLTHDQSYIRYLAIKILCTFLHAADAAFQEILQTHLPEGPANGPWDDKIIDYRYLDLWEQRLHSLYQELQPTQLQKKVGELKSSRIIGREDLMPLTITIGGILQPRVTKAAATRSPLVDTHTTNLNLTKLGLALVDTKPVLVTGVAGSGKSSLIREAARVLGTSRSMLTLHLNEQTDAKPLIGMYTSTGAPGSFKWQPGVLTTAVREGRWVLIEDLDRAPSEVISTILPLMERKQLYVPNLGGSITADPQFKLFATIRSATGRNGKELISGRNFLGAWRWRRVNLEPLDRNDLKEIVTSKYPLIRAYSDHLMQIYQLLSSEGTGTTSARSRERITSRYLGPRDLLKCCARVNRILKDAGMQTGFEPASERIQDSIFLEIRDCFIGYAESPAMIHWATSITAQVLHMPAQRRDHCLWSHVPGHNIRQDTLQIGRALLPRRNSRHAGRVDAKTERPFALTNDTLRKLEAIAATVRAKEPCLLVGETGTGKTTAVQELADLIGHKLTVVNLSQQSEAGDLLGGFKPLDLRTFALPLRDEFQELFTETLPSGKNERFLKSVNRAFAKREWSRLITLWQEAVKSLAPAVGLSNSENGENPAKRRKLGSERRQQLKTRWDQFVQRLNVFEMHVKSGGKGFAFHFVEGNIVKAVRNGDWILLDEINLASPDTLESLADLLTTDAGEDPFLILTETGEAEKIQAHADFRIFAAMNPATDIGKRDLPASLRSRFTELFVASPDRDPQSLLQIVKTCLNIETHHDQLLAQDVTKLYLDVVTLEAENKLVDGANQRPHYSLRTLTRTLAYAREIAPMYKLRRSLFEGFCMSFLTMLNQSSADLVASLIRKYILTGMKSRKAELKQLPAVPTDGKSYVRFEHYWLLKGPQASSEEPHYILTPFVRSNLLNLVRAASTRKFPILLQGPTSSGKTSMVQHLAKISGNYFVRINNHEHTDLQEYLGTYVTDNDGQLRFQEGVLVQALRQGHWVVLDELNLAPTDILEALNRLLDDNRELFIPETQEVVRPHENFMLFATQNPAGLYGGRKPLSRAFRNRFLELHFDDIPQDELQEILTRRTQIAPSYAKDIIQVYRKLVVLRQSSRLFEQKNSFATLRDLFRWALRDAKDRHQLALHGYMLLAERVRNEEERIAVGDVIADVLKSKLNNDELYAPEPLNIPQESGIAMNVVWTRSMRRVFILVTEALRRNEPVLLVGGTGCGKTTICQVVAELAKRQLHIVNAHQNTETGDLIGAQRPVRNRAELEAQLRSDIISAIETACQPIDEQASLQDLIANFKTLSPTAIDSCNSGLISRIESGILKAGALFEWADGSLIHAMKQGQYFLLDEISLADDSVLERLNSLLEPGRTILLAEKGPQDSLVAATDGFQFLATMNPGGDFGKRELSPALRNRFTEIWVPPMSSEEEIAEIAEAKLKPNMKSVAKQMVRFSLWYGSTFRQTGPALSIREVLTWVSFVNCCERMNDEESILAGAAMVYIDALGADPAASLHLSSAAISNARELCLDRLSAMFASDMKALYHRQPEVRVTDSELIVGGFSIVRRATVDQGSEFSLRAPTTAVNISRIVRALQINKPILMEGNPGVGKTTLVAALADVIGMPLTRMNLSEQTDLMDLFGSDVPVEGGEAGQFAWRDAPFLQAMQHGYWVLLDEMNLASQSVLEGLNACLDHRGEVYVPELEKTFTRHPSFKVFAAQNPHSQGGGRKGLPASFVNRFTVVYADVLSGTDLLVICKERFAQVSEDVIQKIIHCVTEFCSYTQASAQVSALGGPWDFNLRDILRWLQLIADRSSPTPHTMFNHFECMLLQQRLRSPEHVTMVESKVGLEGGASKTKPHMYCNLSPTTYQAGIGTLPRMQTFQHITKAPRIDHLALLESIMVSVRCNWPVLLVGPTGSGKTNLIRHLGAMTGADLIELPLSADMDTMDIVGGYEQVDHHASVKDLFTSVTVAVTTAMVQGRLSTDGTLGWKLLALLFTELLQLKDLEVLLAEAASKSSQEVWQDLLQRCRAIQSRLSEDLRARFEWKDGVLVKALQEGKWLILDNANFCSPSVLDRLNSLLEPNGTMLINEHRSTNGSAKVIRPHPNFRLFLTIDPRHGELSRAMRNRCIELFVPLQGGERREQGYSESLTNSSLFRMQAFTHQSWSSIPRDLLAPLYSISFDHLAFLDRTSLDSFYAQFVGGLQPVPSLADNEAEQNISHEVALFIKETNIKSETLAMYQNAAGILHYGNDDLVRFESIHPMNNPLILHFIPSHESPPPAILGALHDCWVYAQRNLARLAQQQREVFERRSQPTSRLERSLLANHVFAFAKDSTRLLAPFLQACLSSVVSWLEAQSWRDHNRKSISFIRSILAFLQDVLDLSCQVIFDEPTFRTYITIGRQLLMYDHYSGKIQCLAESIESQLGIFESQWRLATGNSMVKIWALLKPQSAKDEAHLSSLLQYRALSKQFDQDIWRTQMSISDLSMLRVELINTYCRLMSDQSSIENAKELVSSFESTIIAKDVQSSASRTVVPYFRPSYETILQCSATAQLTESFKSDSKLEVLACRPLSTVLHGKDEPAMLSLLRQIARSTGVGTDDQVLTAFKQTCMPMVMGQLALIHKVPLSSLQLLEDEMQILPQSLVQLSSHPLDSPVEILQAQLGKLHFHMLQAHRQSLDAHFLNAFSEQLARVLTKLKRYVSDIEEADLEDSKPQMQEQQTQNIYETQMTDSLNALEKAVNLGESHFWITGIAWVAFSTGCLLLYLPDKPFDPALEAIVARARHQKRKSELKTQLKALETYEQLTGQVQNTPRILATVAELASLGNEPPAPRVLRPAHSLLNQLQGDFWNILSSVVHRCSGLSINNREILNTTHFLEQNVRRAILRISDQYPQYEDLVEPAVWLLRCLQLGLSTCSVGETQPEPVLNTLQTVASFTPLLGFDRNNLLSIRSDSLHTGQDSDMNRQAAYLEAAIVDATVTGSIDSQLAQIAQEIFDHLYKRWSQRLARDQTLYAARNSLYRYQGDYDDATDDETTGIEEVFPTYTDGELRENMRNSSETAYSSEHRRLAVELADLHQRFYWRSEASQSAFESWFKRSVHLLSSHLNSVDQTCYVHIPTGDFIPAAVILVAEESESLQPKMTQKPKNFYKVSNIQEARRIRDLALRLRARFSTIHETWPEQASPLEVLKTVDELLQFPYTEPVAKFLTKTQQLHTFVYQWQQVASQEFGASSLYIELTDLLVSWRRLELSTWAGVLDAEDESCQNDAKSWWFVAYEAIIAASLTTIQADEDLRSHVVKLIDTLGDFMRTTSLGQYSHRLKIIANFRSHVISLQTHIQALSILIEALSNFIDYYGRFQDSVNEELKQGRSDLEKRMKEVILLSSWKDTNMEALRVSAKASHVRLYKIIRKYRALLAKPTEPIILQGTAFTHPHSPTHDVLLSLRPRKFASTAEALEIYQKAVADWQERPQRFQNPVRTISTMHSLTAFPWDILDCAAFLRDWSTNINTASEALRNETPTLLDSDNKQIVQHLKVRKRKLFAEVLKDLRHMGFRTNLDTKTLDKHSSYAKVLATSGTLDGLIECKNANGGFFHFFENLYNIMAASREYSEDLASNEVLRSLTYIHGLADLMIQQRKNLSDNVTQLQELDRLVTDMSDVWSPDDELVLRLVGATPLPRKQAKVKAKWLTVVLTFATQLLEKLEGMGSVETEAVRTGLQRYVTNFAQDSHLLEKLPNLPGSLMLKSGLQACEGLMSHLRELEEDISAWQQEYPVCRSVLRQLRFWLMSDPYRDAETDISTSVTFVDLDQEIMGTINEMLAGLQLVSASLKQGPSSEDEYAWLMRREHACSQAMKNLRIGQITAKGRELLIYLGNTGNDTQLEYAAAMLGYAQPFFQQYLESCVSVLNQYIDHHVSLVRTACTLSDHFKVLLTQGFCGPQEESHGEKAGQDKVEEGTGLGEGEGAEDISKDIQDDEDLSELVQSAAKEEKDKDIDAEDNAVDMADQDLEGKMDKDAETWSDSEQEDRDANSENQPEEELGDVGDSDPEAVDEKLWDGKDDEGREEEKQGKEAEGRKTDKMDGAEGSERAPEHTEPEQDSSEADEVDQDQVNVVEDNLPLVDPYAHEEEKLDLPEDLDMEGDRKSGSVSELDIGDFEDVESDIGDDSKQDPTVEADVTEDVGADTDEGHDLDRGMDDEGEEEKAEIDDVPHTDAPSDDQEEWLHGRENNHNDDDQVTGVTDGLAGSANQEQEPLEQQQATAGGTTGDAGAMDRKQAEHETGESNQAQSASDVAGDNSSRPETVQETTESQAFKKLGDALERFNRGNKEIIQPGNAEREQRKQNNISQEASEFEHLPDDVAEAETQALGAAEEEVLQGLDNAAMDLDMLDAEQELMQDNNLLKTMGEPEHSTSQNDTHEDEETNRLDDPARTKIGPRSTRDFDDTIADGTVADSEQDIKELDDGLSEVHLNVADVITAERSLEEAQQLWQQCEATTQELALSLTEQLRLILAPTLATKLRGDFRTGKRLNIKRIIPYIASQYKRDKIWMRRSIPSKRNYQIMLAVDDSKSMAEGGNGSSKLAFETLALVSRSLSMLEAGQLCIVSFGEHVQVAHAFEQQFSSAAGSHVLQQFQFQQTKTDIRNLVAKSLDLFREARAQAQNTSTDLWQLQLIISDGVCEDHESILQLVRQAHEERVMIVFIIVDALNGESIANLQEASFEANTKGEMEIRTRRYLDRFPFDYYLIVGDIRELPAVLATALRQWFSEVVDT